MSERQAFPYRGRSAHTHRHTRKWKIRLVADRWGNQTRTRPISNVPLTFPSNMWHCDKRFCVSVCTMCIETVPVCVRTCSTPRFHVIHFIAPWYCSAEFHSVSSVLRHWALGRLRFASNVIASDRNFIFLLDIEPLRIVTKKKKIINWK